MKRRWAYALLLLPFIGTLCPWLYDSVRPVVAGMPFFYWYQLAWIPLTAALLGMVASITRDSHDA
jgi:Protein of unknown function (DUF3311)